jgi:hypothetical protein
MFSKIKLFSNYSMVEEIYLPTCPTPTAFSDDDEVPILGAITSYSRL